MLLDKAELAIHRAEAIRQWEENHYLKKSESVVNGIVSMHKDTNEPCTKNPCYQALWLQDLGITMERIA
tara:strand:+ start:121 stop:327 length:207 start_codon:yes stop_codon:yes gene_type:complete